MGKKSIRDIHNEHLRDLDVASEYLNEALSSGNSEVILMAIRNIVEAQEGGFATVAERSELGRESMYKMLSAHGNPKLNTLTALFHGLGLEMYVRPNRHLQI